MTNIPNMRELYDTAATTQIRNNIGDAIHHHFTAEICLNRVKSNIFDCL